MAKKTCLHCGSVLQKYRWGESMGRPGSVGYDGNGFFCTLRCGYQHAVAAAQRLHSALQSTGKS